MVKGPRRSSVAGYRISSALGQNHRREGWAHLQKCFRKEQGKPELRNVFSWLAFSFAVAVDVRRSSLLPTFLRHALSHGWHTWDCWGKVRSVPLSEHLEFFPH